MKFNPTRWPRNLLGDGRRMTGPVRRQLRAWQSAITILVLVVFATSLLGGCLVDTTPKPQATQEAIDRPAQGTLRLAGADPATLDPSLVGDINSFQYIVQIFSGLVAIDNKMQIVPDLATNWDISPDGKTYSFNLRRDAKFQNGAPITADAFKYSIERAADPKTKSVVAQLYLGDIVGALDKLDGRAREVSGVRVVGPYTLQIQIDSPKAFFLAKLTYPTAYALDKSSIEGDPNWTTHPNGSGPFRLKSWQQAQSLVLVRNDQYYGQKATIAEVDFYLGGGSPVTMYETGNLDVAPVGLADIDRVLDKHSSLNAELATTPELSLTYLGLNTQMKPFDDQKVRQAFAYATDKDKLANVLFKKTRLKAKGVLPPGMPGYNEALQGIGFDVPRAQALLAQSSYGGPSNLPEMTLTVSAGGSSLARSLAEMYKRNLGVDINVEQVDEAFQDELSQRKYQMFVTGWVADYPDQQDFLDIFFHGKSNGNFTLFADPQVDSELEAARVEGNAERRAKLYQNVENEVIQAAPIVPLFHDVDYELVKPYVKGLALSPLGIIVFKDATIAK